MSSLQQKAASSFGIAAIATILCVTVAIVAANSGSDLPSNPRASADKPIASPEPSPEPQPEPVAPANEPPPSALVASLDPASVQKGKQAYDMFCLACHGAEDTSIDSPSNLFDRNWYHGSGREGIEKSIRIGIMEKGMPGWGEMIPAEDITALVDYLLSFQK